MMNKSQIQNFNLKKRYVFFSLVLVFTAKYAYNISTEDERYLAYLDNPPLITERWPKIGGGFVTLEFPATYLYNATVVMQPSTENENNYNGNKKSKYEEICEKFTCTELYQVLLPKLEPKNRYNTKYFHHEINSKDEVYFDDHYLRIYTSTTIFTTNVKKYIPLNADFLIKIDDIFHFRDPFNDLITHKVKYADIIKKSKIKKIEGIDLMQIYDVDDDMLGGKRKKVIYLNQVGDDYENKVYDPHQKLFYYTMKDGNLARVISCTSVQNFSNEQETLKLYLNPKRFNCIHNFIIDELNIKVEMSYSKIYLNDSIKIENQVRKMFLNFVKEK